MAESPFGRSRTHNDRVTELFEKWSKYIRYLLRNRKSVPPSDIDDLAQEVFLRLLRYSDETEIESPGGYLSRITQNVANEWCERARVRHPHDESALAELLSESDDEPEMALARTQRSEHVQAALEELPARRRKVLLSRVEHGMTYKEIARQQGLTHRVVVRDLARAYKTLRFRLNPEDL